ncbi:MAG: hypothetical protein V4850_09985 [Myxococcota bacterium]
MTRRLVASLLIALLAPTTALACAMPRRFEAKALANVMDEIDAAAAPAAPVQAAPVQTAPAVQTVASAQASAQASVPTSMIPEAAAAQTP